MKFWTILSVALAALYLSFEVVRTADASARGGSPSAPSSTDMAHEDFSDLFAQAEPYVALRAKLLRHGWKPLITKRKRSDDSILYDFEERNDLIKAGFVEVENCEGFDINSCVFNFKKGNFCLNFNAVGGYSAKYKSPVLFSESRRRCKK